MSSEENMPAPERNVKTEEQIALDESHSPKMTVVGETPHNKKSPTKYIILSIITAVFSIIAFAKYYYSFMIMDDKYYKSNFLSWRALFADKSMYSNTWQYIQKSKYYANDPNNSYTKFVKRMQNDQLLFTGHPEHYPRQHKHYNTHSNHPFNDDFLEFRKSFCDAYDEPLDEMILSGKHLLNDKKKLGWLGKEGKHTKKLFDKAPKRIKEFMYVFTDFLNKIYKKKYAKTGLIGSKVPEEIIDDMEKMSKAAGLDLSRNYLAELPVKFGLVKPKTIESFGYSRLFYLFYFCTLDCDINVVDNLDKSKDGESAIEKEKRESKLNDLQKKSDRRLRTVADCFTQLMSDIYEHEKDAWRKNMSGFHRVMGGIMGVKEAKIKDQSKNIGILMDELNEVVDDKN